MATANSAIHIDCIQLYHYLFSRLLCPFGMLTWIPAYLSIFFLLQSILHMCSYRSSQLFQWLVFVLNFWWIIRAIEFSSAIFVPYIGFWFLGHRSHMSFSRSTAFHALAFSQLYFSKGSELTALLFIDKFLLNFVIRDFFLIWWYQFDHVSYLSLKPLVTFFILDKFWVVWCPSCSYCTQHLYFCI